MAGLSDTGNLDSILFDVGEVAADIDVRVAGRIEKLIDDHASPAIERNAEQLAERGGLNPGGPEGDGGVDPLVLRS